MKLLTFITIMIAFTINVALADTPMPKPKTYKAYSSNGLYYVLVDVERNKTSVCYNLTTRIDNELWQINGYYTSVYISDDGQFLIIGYGGMNLLPLNYRPDEIAFSVYRNGEQYANVQFNEVINDFT